jgi:serine/threonine-protein kinase
MVGRDRFDAHELIGRTLKGKWRLDALLGMGGTGMVFAATHRTGARLAVKLLHPRLRTDAERCLRFRREAYVANAVRHPHVVSIFDDDVDADGTPFLVMELLEGASLETLRRAAQGKLEPALVRKVADGVLDVLAAAHVRKILHRDIKPSNLFLTREGAVKVLDFGVAAAALVVDGEGPHTHDNAVLGTPGYMAPEQARSQWERVDARSDLWALGATMFTLLSGEPVHLAETPSEQLGLAMTASARSLRTVAPELPAELVRVVDRALLYDPGARFANAETMRAALRGSPGEARREPITMAPVTITEAATAPALRARHPRRSSWRWLALVPVALVAAAGSLLASARSRQPAPAQVTPVSPLVPAASIPTPATAAPVSVTTMASSSDAFAAVHDVTAEPPPSKPKPTPPHRGAASTKPARAPERVVAMDPWDRRL